jgi:hypothetical protein
MNLIKCITSLSTFVLLLNVFTTVAKQPELQLWNVDALVKVFPAAIPEKAMAAEVDVARGEHASLQVVIRSDAAIQGLRAQVSEFKRTLAAGSFVPRPVRFVGYVPVNRPPQKLSKDQLRKPFADYPDPLLESDTLDVPAGKAQVIWITIPVPTNDSPGIYRGTLTFSGTGNGKPVRVASLSVAKTQSPAELQSLNDPTYVPDVVGVRSSISSPKDEPD